MHKEIYNGTVHRTSIYIILVGECSAFLASGSDPTDDSRMEHSIQCVLKVPDHTGTKRSERSGSLHERVDCRHERMNALTAGMNA